MPGKRRANYASEDVPVTGLSQGPMPMMGPGFLPRVKASGPPAYHSLAAEEQEMAILAMLAMPEDHDSVPYSDQFSTDRIFNKHIVQRQQMSWQDQPTHLNMNNLLPAETFVASFSGVGSVWRRFVWHDPNANEALWTYSLRDSEFYATDEIYPEEDGTGQMNFNIGVATADYKPHGDQIVCGRTLKQKYANASWIWIDGVPSPESGSGSQVEVTWPGPITLKACTFDIVAWAGGKFEAYDSITFTAADATLSKAADILRSDYYSIFYRTANAAADTNFDSNGVQISVGGNCSVLSHVQVRSAWKNRTQLGPGCMRAASLRMTEMAAPLNVQGESTVAATRENGTWWQFYVQGNGGANSVFKPISNYREAYLGPLLIGGYAYHLPRDMDDYRKQDYLVLNYDTGETIDVWFNLEDQRIVNVYSARTLNTGANTGQTGQGADCWLTVASHFDGTVDNDWVDQWYPNVSFETWMHALELMRGVPRCMSNKWHIKELVSELFKRGKLVAKRYAGPLIKVAGRAAAEYLAGQSPLAADGIKLLQQAYNVGNEITGTLVNGSIPEAR
jgi:hypothetical protein